MEIRKFSYGKTVCVDGDYEKANVEIDVHPGDDMDVVRSTAFEAVAIALGTTTSSEAPSGKVKKTTKASAKSEEAATDDEPAKTTKKKVAKKATKKAPAKPKVVEYKNTDKKLKKRLTDYLDESYEGWSEDGDFISKLKAGVGSLEGTEMIDAEDNLLESFTESVDALFA